MHELFQEDFNKLGAGLGSGIGMAFAPRGMERPDGGKIDVEGQLFIDSNSATKFVAFFLPRSPYALEACVFLADNYDKVIPVEGLQMETHQPGQGPMSSAQFPFSGRIFIYHENPFTPEEIGALYGLYKQKNLLLELRGNDYLQFELYRREAAKAALPHK
jgi:hypothetical protein